MGIVLAHLLPDIKVVMIDSKVESMLRARQRVKELGLRNTVLMQGNLEYFFGDFQVGTSLHSCGVATDLILDSCIRKLAAFVLSPCCYGAIHHYAETSIQGSKWIHTQIGYPRSQRFREAQFEEEDMLVMGSIAERTEWDFQSAKAVAAKRFMGVVDTDRLLFAAEKGYQVTLSTFRPAECSPKNNMITGCPIGHTLAKAEAEAE